MFVRRVHWASDGMPVLDMETDEELLPVLRNVSVTVTISEPSPKPPRTTRTALTQGQAAIPYERLL